MSEGEGTQSANVKQHHYNEIAEGMDYCSVAELEAYDAMYSTEWRAARWRENMFGVKPPPCIEERQMREMIGHDYLNGHGSNPYFPEWRQRLPPGADVSWKRGTWAPVPVTWLDRASGLYSKIRAEDDQRLEEGENVGE